MIEAGNPQLEHGYTQIANEILEALTRVNLNAYETRAMLFVIRKTYGWKKKKDWISLSQFSKGLALDRRHVFRALKGLENKGLVVIYRDDKKHPRYGFQKDYLKWNMPESSKSSILQSNSKRKKSAYPDDRVSSIQAPTKEIITKETLKEREKEKLQPLFFSVKEVQNPKKEEAQRLHKWLVREQAAYIKEHGAEDLEKIDWVQYVKTYYRG